MCSKLINSKLHDVLSNETVDKFKYTYVSGPVFAYLPLSHTHSEVELKFDFSVSCRVLRDALGRRYGVRNPSFYGLRHQGWLGFASAM